MMNTKLLISILLLFSIFGCKSKQQINIDNLKPAVATDNGNSGGAGGGGAGGGGAGGAGSSGGSTNITTGIAKVNTGDDHSCLLTADHRVLCSGDNGDYQTGGGLVARNYDYPAAIDVTSTFGGLIPVDISVVYDSSCAVFSNGTAKCWGDNDDGEMGVGHTNDVITPENVQWFDGSTAEKTIKHFELGESVGCAVSAADSLYCWGDNHNFIFDSQTGPADPNDPTAPLPALLPAITTPMAIAAYDGSTAAKTVKEFHIGQRNVCVLSMALDFKCFGQVRDDDLNGNQYHVSFVPATAPFLAHGLDGTTAAKKVTNFSLGYSHGCYITEEQNVFCWGSNGGGKLGMGLDYNAMEFSGTPVQVINLDDTPLSALVVTAGDYQTCAITLDHKVKCWGSGWDGQMGNGLYNSIPKATTVTKVDGSDLSNVAFIHSGDDAGHICALTPQGEMYCWGDNGDGQLFMGSNSKAPYAKLMPTTAVSKVAKGYYNDSHSCYIKTDGSVICSDNNNYAFLLPVDGNGDNLIDGTIAAKKAQYIFQDGNGGCATMLNGSVNCWDSNITTTNVAYFDVSDGQHTASKVIKAANQTCALTTSGTVRCSLDAFVTPFLINVLDISGMDIGFCALDFSGVVTCYEFDWMGALTSHAIANLDGSSAAKSALSISTNSRGGCATTQNNKVSCWPFSGNGNEYGQLGNGLIVDDGSAIPYEASFINVIDGTTKVAAKVELGDIHACVQLTNREIYCWGHNYDFQASAIPRMEDSNIPTPTKVSNLPTGETFTMNILGNMSCVVGDSSGKLYCWGKIYSGGLTEDPDQIARATLISP